jgi:flagellar basal-body rod protein FlgG
MQALYTAATGMEASSTNIDVIANNLANQNTNAFKKKRAEFKDLVYVNQNQAGVQSSNAGTIRPVGTQIGLGVRVSSIYSMYEQGSLQQTGAPLDVAISGEGFLHVTMPDGSDAYTRDGALQRSATGEIVTSDGYAIAPGITVPEDAIAIDINASGEVIATLSDDTTSNLGQLELIRFLNPTGLRNIANNYVRETEASGTALAGVAGDAGFGTFIQGFLEGSNVVAVTEITDLIKVQRAFEMNLKVLEAADESMQAVNESV